MTVQPHPDQHPIEAESFRIIDERVDLSAWPRGERTVVTRIVHAAADIDYAGTVRFVGDAVAAGVRALRAGAPVIADVEMVAAATHRCGSRTWLAEGRTEKQRLGATEPDLTISAAAMRAAAARHPRGAIVVIGCAPTALFEVISLARTSAFAPALVIGLPVGFVGALESKEALRDSPLVSISNVGERGGSAVAAAALNALARLAADPAFVVHGSDADTAGSDAVGTDAMGTDAVGTDAGVPG